MASMSSPQQKISWVVVGQGAIGLLAACRLQQATYPVQLYLRQPRPLSVIFENANGSTPCQFSPASPPLRYLFIAVKAYDVKACLAQLRPQLSHDAQLVLSHNGMPDLTYLQSVVTAQQGLWFLSTSHGALRTESSVMHTGQGQSILSPLNSVAKDAELTVVEAMAQALGPVTLTADIRPALWRKLAVNAVINPLTALHHCRNGALASEAFRPQISRIIAEVCQLAALEQIELDLQHTTAHVYQVMQATAENYSSMQQDRFYQRPLELDAISGFIVNTAAKHRLAVPENLALWQALQSSTAPLA